jgi:OmpA family
MMKRLLVILLSIGLMAPVHAQDNQDTGVRLDAAIWVDPDGCEHWVIDTGMEGYMSPRLDKDGKPVCQNLAKFRCNYVGVGALFAVNSAVLTKDARKRLEQFFSEEIDAGSTRFLVDGHTDNTASVQYNLALSERRAEAVAAIARALGGTAQARGFGELSPIASNATEEGRSRNRRVEIYCE